MPNSGKHTQQQIIIIYIKILTSWQSSCYVSINLYLNLQEEKLLLHDVGTGNGRAEDRFEVAAANVRKTHVQASQQDEWWYSGSICRGKDLPRKLPPWIQIRILCRHLKEGKVYCPPQHGSNPSLCYWQHREHMVVFSSDPTGHLQQHDPPSEHIYFLVQEGSAMCWDNNSVQKLWRIRSVVQGQNRPDLWWGIPCHNKNELFGFDNKSVSQMLKHLKKQCLVLTVRNKKTKMKDVNIPWDRDDGIETYFLKANKLEEDLQEN